MSVFSSKLKDDFIATTRLNQLFWVEEQADANHVVVAPANAL